MTDSEILANTYQVWTHPESTGSPQPVPPDSLEGYGEWRLLSQHIIPGINMRHQFWWLWRALRGADYPLLAGRAGDRTLIGGTVASDAPPEAEVFSLAMLPRAVRFGLEKRGVKHLAELATWTERDILLLNGVGPGGLAKVKREMGKRFLWLAP